MNAEPVDELLSDIPAVTEFHAESASRVDAHWGEAREPFTFKRELPLRPESIIIDLRGFTRIVWQSITPSPELAKIYAELSELRELIQERPTIRPTILTSLGTTGLALTRPIAIVIEEWDSECLARWPEGQATGRGISEPAAIESLRHDIAFLYADLMDTDDSAMIPELRVVRDVLRATVKG